MMIYVNQSKGLIPLAPKKANTDYDAWYFVTTTSAAGPTAVFDNIQNSPLGKILKLNKNNYRVLVCPMDQLAPRVKPPSYPYSYIFNRMFNGSSATPNTPGTAPGTAVGILKLTECRAPAEKIWIFEENDTGPRSRDDGNGELWTTNWGNVNLPSIRHDDRAMKLPDDATAAGVPNAKRRTNVMFADGHADFMDRAYVLSKSHCCPRPERSGGAEILIAPPPLN
jgi:prepilin-type processing-associated H-X9-DG protein